MIRKLTLAICLGAGIAAVAPAHAQLPDIIDRTITKKVEDKVADAIDNKVTRSVEQAVTGTVQTAVDNSVTQGVARAVEGALPVTAPLLDKVVNAPVTPPLRPFREVAVADAWRAVDHEWIALVPPDKVAALNVPAIRVLSRTNLAASGLVMLRVQVSDADDNAGRAQQVLRNLGATAADRNHVYSAQGEEASREPEPAPAPTGGSPRARIGLIDTSVNTKHSALRQAKVTAKDFVETKGARPTAHGTSIAALLVGVEKGHEGLLRDGQLYSASVFYQGDSGATGATTSALIAALDWMAVQHVTVVNMSLAGPPNETLRVILDRMIAQGMLIVAAVGNEGPGSRPLYPAGYEPVIAVTAVDKGRQIYRWANQGPQVDLAAYGVKTMVARDKGGYDEESGTSFAAPVVAAMLAQKLARGDPGSAAVEALIRSAEDLGTKGKDNTFGYGLVTFGQ